jgi:D-alanyl-D-alanine carboxypeptidase/D-alanyl-D-alanine-endopeptidase (penicillin-binding protein 4)
MYSEDISLMNASGLARDSKIKTSALSQFLYKYHESQFSSEYLASLSILGVDGTAKARLNQFAGRGRVKTGTLRDVRSIAGYIYDEKHRPYSFAMFFNDVSMGDPKIKATEDEILEKIFRKNFKFFSRFLRVAFKKTKQKNPRNGCSRFGDCYLVHFRFVRRH